MLPSALALAFFAIFAAAADDKPCTAYDGSRYYDLTPLQSRTDYEFSSLSGQKYILNVCRSVVHEMWNVGVDIDSVAGFMSKDRGDFSIGKVNTTLLVRDKHPLLILTEGSVCPNAEHMHAMTAVRFICDTSVFGSGTPQLVAQLPPEDENACSFFIEWRTHYACPAGEDAGLWGGLTVAIFIILTVGLMSYIVGRTLYNRYVLHLRGFDQIPRFSIFSFTDTLDALQSCGDRLLGKRGGRAWHEESTRGGRRGFERLPTHPEEEQAIMENGSRGPSLDEDHAERGPNSGGHASEGQGQARGVDAREVIRL